MTPAAAFLHAATGTDYAAQILAEQKRQNEHGQEEWVNIHQRPNHLLDAEILAATCVEMEFPGGGLRLLAGYTNRLRQQDGEAGEEPVRSENKANLVGRKKGWFKR